MRFTVEAVGVWRQKRRLQSVSDRMRDMRPVGDEILDALADAERRHFRRKPWPPLARSTRARKARQGLSHRPMYATGLLDRTLSNVSATSKGNGLLTRRGKTSVTFGIKGGRADIFYGRFHQRGTGVPKRVVIPKPSALTRAEIGGIVLRHITREAR